MRGNESLEKIFTALKSLGGYFTVTDSEGQEFVIMAKEDMLTRISRDVQITEIQLPLQAQSLEDEIAEVNKAIAAITLQEDDEELLKVISDPEPDKDEPLPPPRRVRFEAIRGDLPPELQE